MPGFFIGARFGKLVLKGRVRVNMKASYNTRKRWRCVCDCGTELTIPEMYLTRKPNPKEDCGCSRKTNKTIYNEEYRIWLMMQERTMNATHVSYKHYGGRGICVCEEWLHPETGFDAFLAYVGPRPGPEYSIDRYPNNDGNYEPGNVRWATAQQQSDNKGRK